MTRCALELDDILGVSDRSSGIVCACPADANIIAIAVGCNVVLMNFGTDPRESTVLRAHDGPICRMTYSRNGRILASGQVSSSGLRSAVALVVAWDTTKRAKAFHNTTLLGEITALAVSDDGCFLAAGGLNPQISIFSLSSGETVYSRRVDSVGEWISFIPQEFSEYVVRAWEEDNPRLHRSTKYPDCAFMSSVGGMLMWGALVFDVPNLVYKLALSGSIESAGASALRQYTSGAYLRADRSRAEPGSCAFYLVLGTSTGDMTVVDPIRRTCRSMLSLPSTGGSIIRVCSERDMSSVLIANVDGAVWRLLNTCEAQSLPGWSRNASAANSARQPIGGSARLQLPVRPPVVPDANPNAISRIFDVSLVFSYASLQTEKSSQTVQMTSCDVCANGSILTSDWTGSIKTAKQVQAAVTSAPTSPSSVQSSLREHQGNGGAIPSSISGWEVNTLVPTGTLRVCDMSAVSWNDRLTGLVHLTETGFVFGHDPLTKKELFHLDLGSVVAHQRAARPQSVQIPGEDVVGKIGSRQSSILAPNDALTSSRSTNVRPSDNPSGGLAVPNERSPRRQQPATSSKPIRARHCLYVSQKGPARLAVGLGSGQACLYKPRLQTKDSTVEFECMAEIPVTHRNGVEAILHLPNFRNRELLVTAGIDTEAQVRIWLVDTKELVVQFADLASRIPAGMSLPTPAASSAGVGADEFLSLHSSLTENEFFATCGNSFSCYSVAKENGAVFKRSYSESVAACAVVRHIEEANEPMVVTAHGNGVVLFWDKDIGGPVSRLRCPSPTGGPDSSMKLSALAVSDSDNYYAVGTDNGLIAIYDTRHKTLTQASPDGELWGHFTGGIRKILFVSHDRAIASLGTDGSVHIWNFYPDTGIESPKSAVGAPGYVAGGCFEQLIDTRTYNPAFAKPAGIPQRTNK